MARDDEEHPAQTLAYQEVRTLGKRDYEQGYRDGEGSMLADFQVAFDDWTFTGPTDLAAQVAARIDDYDKLAGEATQLSEALTNAELRAEYAKEDKEFWVSEAAKWAKMFGDYRQAIERKLMLRRVSKFAFWGLAGAWFCLFVGAVIRWL